MEPLVVGTIAMLEVMKPSRAFSVETVGWCSPSGHKVRKGMDPGGTTVALKMYAAAVLAGAHALPTTFTVFSPMKGGPLFWRVSSTRQGAIGYIDNPPVPAGAK